MVHIGLPEVELDDLARCVEGALAKDPGGLNSGRSSATRSLKMVMPWPHSMRSATTLAGIVGQLFNNLQISGLDSVDERRAVLAFRSSAGKNPAPSGSHGVAGNAELDARSP